MDTNLWLQLLSSFFIGGISISALSLLAEKANEKVSGILMMFPSTIVIGFFFLALTSSPSTMASIIPSTLIPLGIVVLSAVLYIELARWFERHIESRMAQIIVTFISSSLIWFAIASPLAIWKINNLALGISGYFLLIIIAHYLLHRHKIVKPHSKPKYTKGQILFRGVFIGLAIAIVVLLGKKLNPFWGGIFTMYPASTFSSLAILHFYYKPEQLFHFMKKAPVGSLSLFVYALSAMILFPRIGLGLGTALSFVISSLFAFLLAQLQNRKGKAS